MDNNIDLRELTKLSEQIKLIEKSILILTIFIICSLLISLIFIFLYVRRIRRKVDNLLEYYEELEDDKRS
jgi:hypothetical protein